MQKERPTFYPPILKCLYWYRVLLILMRNRNAILYAHILRRMCHM